jgi:uncharacterized protein (DUF1697 family)
MQSYVVLLRAVNVTGTGKIAMSDLKALCEAAGCDRVRTYIASGNVVLRSALEEQALQAEIARRVEPVVGKRVGVILRSAHHLERALAVNPFREMNPGFTVICFLDAPPPADALDQLRNRIDEQVALGEREVFIHYPNGQGQSRLIIPAAKEGTARNLNTVRKLLEMVSAL